jgi:acyl-CoA dehydrogenase
MGLADGPTEVHKVTIAKQLLRDYEACQDLFPPYHRPTAKAAALEKFKAVLG